MSIDPVTTDANTGGSFNRYAYANNNPYKFLDPDGRNPALLRATYSASFFVATRLGAAELGSWIGLGLAGLVIATNTPMKSVPQGGPPANDGYAKKHGGDKHNDILDERAAALRNDPDASDVRKNQTQVDVYGNKLDNNRPDIQFNKDGKHHNEEYDNDEKASKAHGERIKANDPNAETKLEVIEQDKK